MCAQEFKLIRKQETLGCDCLDKEVERFDEHADRADPVNDHSYRVHCSDFVELLHQQ